MVEHFVDQALLNMFALLKFDIINTRARSRKELVNCHIYAFFGLSDHLDKPNLLFEHSLVGILLVSGHLYQQVVCTACLNGELPYIPLVQLGFPEVRLVCEVPLHEHRRVYTKHFCNDAK